MVFVRNVYLAFVVGVSSVSSLFVFFKIGDLGAY